MTAVGDQPGSPQIGSRARQATARHRRSRWRWHGHRYTLSTSFTPNRPGRPDQQNRQRRDIGEPDLDAAAEQRADINLGELLRSRRPTARRQLRRAIELKPPSTSTGSAFSTTSESENCTPSRAPQSSPATRATKPAAVQTIAQIAAAAGRPRVPRTGSSATARNARPVRVQRKNSDKQRNHHAADRRREQIERLTSTPPNSNRLIVDAEIEPVDLRAPDQLRRAFEDVGEAQRRHEQGDRRPVDQRPQHVSLDRDAEHTITSEREQQARRRRARRARAG